MKMYKKFKNIYVIFYTFTWYIYFGTMIFWKFLYYECICLYVDKKVILLLKLFFVFFKLCINEKKLCKLLKFKVAHYTLKKFLNSAEKDLIMIDCMMN